ncbi:ABC transporter permease [Nonomuraea sp. SMC257]|uniref:ABC transporter permease n=1 Tax=Nonomuraea montanisoli TaxID=2741721 RepID=A0A7Y6IDB6_9ACTN|nr:ABC transporter permease [Nonomuraea montanisoli]NUW36177.1 ABC transporter permease [Nonomuraea montanisoli]
MIRQFVGADKGGLAGSFVALLAASALVTACGVLLGSGLGGGVAAERYAGAPIVISGPDSVDGKPLPERAPIPRALADRIARVPGVRAAVADVGFPVDVSGEDFVAARGHGWASAALAPLRLRSGRPPAAPGEVVVSETIPAGARIGAYRVVGVVEGVTREPVVFFTDAEAARLYGRPHLADAIGVLAAPGVTDTDALADRIEQALSGSQAPTAKQTQTGSQTPSEKQAPSAKQTPSENEAPSEFEVPSADQAPFGNDVRVFTGAARGGVEFGDVGRARGDLQAMGGSFIGFTVMIATVVVTGTRSLAAHRRRRQTALLRIVGAAPGQVRAMFAREMLAVSLVAGLLGAVPGGLLATLLLRAMAWTGMVPADFAVSSGPVPYLAALVVCVLMAQFAAWTVSRRELRIPPARALAEASLEQPGMSRGRLAAGTALLLAGTAAALLPLWLRGVFGVALAASGGLLMIISLVVLGPPLVRAGTRLLRPLLRRRYGAEGYLAAANSLAGSHRLASAVSPMILAIGFALIQLGTATTAAAGAEREVTEGVLATHVLRGGPYGLDPAVAADARTWPGVEAVTPVARTRAFVETVMLDSSELLDYEAQGVDSTRALDLGVTEGSLKGLGKGTVAISVTAAETLGVRPGSTIRIRLGDGTPLRSRVVAVYRRGLGFGDLTLPRELVLAHTATRRDDSVLLRVRPGADLAAMVARHPGVTRSDMSAVARGDQFAGLLSSALPLMLVFGYIAVSVGNSLVLSVSERGGEFGLLLRAGAGRGQVMRMMRAEALLVAALATGLGTLATVLPLAMVSYGLTGSALPYVPPWLYLVIVGGTSLLGAVSLLVPARIVLSAEGRSS